MDIVCVGNFCRAIGRWIKSVVSPVPILLAVALTSGIGYAATPYYPSYYPSGIFTTSDGWQFAFTGKDDVIGGRNEKVDGVWYAVGAVELRGYVGESLANLVMPTYVQFQSASQDFYGVVRSVKSNVVNYTTCSNQYNYFSTTNLVLANTIRRLRKECLLSATNAVSIVFPDRLEYLEENVCYGCKKLKTVTLSSPYLASIGWRCFCGCSTLASVSIEGNGNTVIYDLAFASCYSLKSVKLGSGVKRLGAKYSPDGRYGAFQYCNRLSEIDFGGISYIDENTFNGAGRDASGTVDLDFSKTSITNIGENAFTKANFLRTIRFAENISEHDISIGQGAFSSCTNLLEAVNILVNHQYQFMDCTSLTNVTFSGNCFEITGRSIFNGCKKLEHFVVPNTVTNIGEGAFAGMAIKEMVLPATVSNIPTGLFGSCSSLGRVDILADHPELGIGFRTFGNCSSLTNVVFWGSIAPRVILGDKSYSDCFIGTPNNLVILVKAGSRGWTGDPDSDEIPFSWSPSTCPSDVKRRVAFIPIKILFDGMGGIVTGVRDSYVPRTTFGDSLPTSSREGYVFKGWFSAETCGHLVTESSLVPDDSATYYAYWADASEASPEDSFNRGTHLFLY